MATINLTQGNDNFNDDANSNRINGLAGVDQIYGGLGDDVIYAGDQTTYRQTLTTTVSGGVTTTVATLNITNSHAGDHVDGGDGSDVIYGADGDDQLFGADGGDRLYGGGITTVWQGHLSVTQNAYPLITVDQTFVMIGSGQDQLSGGRGDDLIDGGDDHDVLQGGTGADTLYGGDGYIDLHLQLSKPEGTGLTDIYYGQTAPVYMTGGDDQLAGQAGDDYLDGRDGDDVIAGGSDQDRLYGGQGRVITMETRYYGTLSNPQIGYNTRGTRLIRSQDVYISGGNDQLYGGDGHDELNGQDGDDQLYGGAGHDRLYGGTTVRLRLNTILYSFQHTTSTYSKAVHAQSSRFQIIQDGADQLYGGEGDDQLYGGAGHDQLDGGVGADKMAGGVGNDVYLIDDSGDRIYEQANEGNDSAYVSVNYVINRGVERVYATGAANIAISGNAEANTVYGHDAENLLVGNAGDDLLYGGLGHDQLYGGMDHDLLDGGQGGDLMAGGFGDDTYVVGQAGDQIIEFDGQGMDTVKTSFDYQLTDFVENLILEGSQDLQGQGNLLSNTLYGNQGHNILFGYESNDVLYGGEGNDQLNAGTGLDRLFGGAGQDVLKGSRDDGRVDDPYNGIDYFEGGSGDDSYYIFHDADHVVEWENQGVDTVYSDAKSYTMGANIENVRLMSNARKVYGNDQDNLIFGNNYSNVLSGGAGRDVLNGKAGEDVYLFGRGSGRDLIIESELMGETNPSTDYIAFDKGLRREDFWFSRVGDDLKVEIIGTLDHLQVRDWFVDDQHVVEKMTIPLLSVSPLSNITAMVLDAANVELLVNAMASLTPLVQGQTELSAAQKTALQPIWNQVWQGGILPNM